MLRQLKEKFPGSQQLPRVTQSPASLLNSRQSPEAAAVDWERMVRERYLMELPQGADGRACYLELERRLENEKVVLINALDAMMLSRHVHETTRDEALKQKTEEDRALFLSTLMQTTTEEFLQNVEQIRNSYPETPTTLTILPALNNAYALMLYGDVNGLNEKFVAGIHALMHTDENDEPSTAVVLQNEKMMISMMLACCLALGTDLTFRRVMSRISNQNIAIFKKHSMDITCFAAAHARVNCIGTLHQMGFDLNYLATNKKLPFRLPLEAASNVLYLNNVFQPGAIPAYEKTVDTLLQLGANPEAANCHAIKSARTLIAQAQNDAKLSAEDKVRICAALHKVIDAPSPQVQVVRAGM